MSLDTKASSIEEIGNDKAYAENVERGQVATTDIESSLSERHREYLLQRHGTLDLNPIPSSSDTDPYNWPTRKVTWFSTCVYVEKD